MPMKRYTPDELAEVLRLHKLWLNDKEGGERAYLDRANLGGANLGGANLRGANLRGANLDGAYLDGAYLDGAILRGANLDGAYLDGAYLDGAGRVARMAVFSGLYRYQCWAVAATDGTAWVRMGCLWKTVEEWDRIGIRQSNPGEFPADGSEKSEDRARAFEFTRAEAVRLAAQVQPQAVEPIAPPYREGDRVQISETGRAAWAWAPEGVGRVLECAGGWTRIDYSTQYLTAPDGYLELAVVAEKAV